MLILGAFLCTVGCDVIEQPPDVPAGRVTVGDLYMGYGPASVNIVGLTEFVDSQYGPDAAQIRAYVDVLDAYGSRIKAPGSFRFELYEYVPRSSDPRGRRVILWDDLDLTRPSDNNGPWRDFLRCYQFDLTVEPRPANGTYILQVTCTTLDGKRLDDTLQIDYPTSR